MSQETPQRRAHCVGADRLVDRQRAVPAHRLGVVHQILRRDNRNRGILRLVLDAAREGIEPLLSLAAFQESQLGRVQSLIGGGGMRGEIQIALADCPTTMNDRIQTIPASHPLQNRKVRSYSETRAGAPPACSSGIPQMLRVVLGGMLAAVVVFACRMASWTVLEFHRGTIRALPGVWQELVAGRDQAVHSGVYASPIPPPFDPTMSPEEQRRLQAEFVRQHRDGPLVTLFYRREGSEPFRLELLVKGLAVDLAAAWIAAIVLHLGRSAFHAYLLRVALVALLGVFAAVVGHGGYFVWMQFDWGFTFAMACDVIVSWLLAGLVLAAVVKELPSDVRDRRPLLRPPGVEIKTRV